MFRKEQHSGETENIDDRSLHGDARWNVYHCRGIRSFVFLFTIYNIFSLIESYNHFSFLLDHKYYIETYIFSPYNIFSLIESYLIMNIQIHRKYQYSLSNKLIKYIKKRHIYLHKLRMETFLDVFIQSKKHNQLRTKYLRSYCVNRGLKFIYFKIRSIIKHRLR